MLAASHISGENILEWVFQRAVGSHQNELLNSYCQRTSALRFSRGTMQDWKRQNGTSDLFHFAGHGHYKSIKISSKNASEIMKQSKNELRECSQCTFSVLYIFSAFLTPLLSLPFL